MEQKKNEKAFVDGTPFLKLRNKKGITQKELAGLFEENGFHIDDKKISRLEQGKYKILDNYMTSAYMRTFEDEDISIEYLQGITPEVPTNNKNVRMICKATGLTQSSVETIQTLKKNRTKYKESRTLQLIDMLNIILSDEVLCEMFLDTLCMILENPFDTQLHYDKKKKAYVEDTAPVKPLESYKDIYDIDDIEVLSVNENHIIVGSTTNKELRRFIPLSFLDTYNKEHLFKIIDTYKRLYEESKGSD